MSMKIKANIAELKQRLSEYLKRVEEGDEISVCKRNVPIARISAEPGPRESGPPPRRPSALADVTGWLEDEDPFFARLEARRAKQKRRPRDPFA
jgi:prevent-host-death family protein